MTRRLVLLGGGHAHVHVLQDFARAPPAGVELLLVTPHARQLYSGMVPGLVAGHYALDDCVIPLQPLAQAAGARWIAGAAVGLDSTQRRVRLADGGHVDYDLLAIDSGGVMDRDALPGAREHALFVRPMEQFVRLLPDLVALAARRPLEIAVIGAGAAGFELVLALQYRLATGAATTSTASAVVAEPARLTLLTGGTEPLAGYPQTVMRCAALVLESRGVHVARRSCIAIEAGTLHLDDGARLRCDAPLLATGAVAPAWLAGSGLDLDEHGFVLTGATLQSQSHPEVFAVGDVATRADVSHPRSGVYAVRAGPPLAANLRRAIAGLALQPHRPQARALNLISCGDRSAIAVWGGWSAHGRWVWRWKDRIDRAFVARYAAAPGAVRGRA